MTLHFLMSSKGEDRSKTPMAEGGLMGSAQQVIDRVGDYVDAGAEQVNIAIRPPVDWDALQTFIDEVMPAFK